MTVAGMFRRNRKMTITTSATVRSSVNCTSATEARMVVVRSVRIRVSIDDGNVEVNWGSSALMRLTTEMMFAPGCRWMFRMTAGVVSIHAACRTFSTSSTTRATSVSLTGAPFRNAITRGR
jgi:hypothetical protein